MSDRIRRIIEKPLSSFLLLYFGVLLGVTYFNPNIIHESIFIISIRNVFISLIITIFYHLTVIKEITQMFQYTSNKTIIRINSPFLLFGLLLLVKAFSPFHELLNLLSLLTVILIISIITKEICKLKKDVFFQIKIILLAVIFGIISVRVLNSINNPNPQFDTWQMLDLSRNIFTDFYRMDMIRQNVYNTQYATCFPPLFPFLIAVANFIINKGVFAALFINTLVIYATIYMFVLISKKYGNTFLGILLSIVLIVNKHYRKAFLGGNSIPLSVLLFTGIVYILISRKEINVKTSGILGFLAGVGCLNRFDFIPIAGVIGICIMFIRKKMKIKNSLVFFGVVLLCLSPWIVYSYIHFNSVFITDNGRRLINIPDTGISTFFTSDSPAPTIFTNFRQWLAASYQRWKVVLISLRGTVSITITFFLIISSIMIKKKIKLNLKNVLRAATNENNRIIIFVSLAVLAQTATIILTGYNDRRYHIILGLWISGLSFVIIIKLLKETFFTNKKVITTILVLAIMLFISNASYVIKYLKVPPFIKMENYLKPTEYLYIIDYLKNKPNVKIAINHKEEEGTLDLPRFAGLCRLTTIMTPDNLSDANTKAFFKYFNITYLYTSDKKQIELIKRHFTIEETPISYLYYIKK
jgi:hypothetical protein